MKREPMGKPPEVAAYYGVTVETLANWRYLGRGPKYTKAGGRVRYRWDDVEEWLGDQARTAA